MEKEKRIRYKKINRLSVYSIRAKIKLLKEQGQEQSKYFFHLVDELNYRLTKMSF